MFKLFKKFDVKDWLMILLIVGFVVLQVWLDLTMPDYTSKLTQSVASGDLSMKEIWKNGGMMLLCAFGSLASSFACGFICAFLAGKFSKKLRAEVYNKTFSFSSAEMKKFSVSSLMTRTTNDIQHIQGFVAMGLQSIIKAPTLAIWAITKISNTSVEWTTATIITVSILVLVVALITIFVLPKFKKVQKQIDELNATARENVSGVRVVRAFNAENYQEEKFEKTNANLTKTQLFTAKLMGILSPFMTLCMNGLTLAICWIGAILVNQASFFERPEVIGNMTAFTQYAGLVIMAFIMLIVIFVFLPRSIVSARRVNEVLETKPSILNGNQTKSQDEVKGKVEFVNVGFKYPDGQNEVISNINFSASSGETVAIIGATGSGKTTLINLIPRFLDATQGQVLVDNIDVKEYDYNTLQDKIAVVSQKACLFMGDIKSNVGYGARGDFDEDKIKKSLEIAQADFVNDISEGLNAKVSQGGTNFSGGQKQRLSIARAVYKDAEIIIFDDSFSALDYKTDMLVRKALKKEMKDKTVIIVAQRIGTIKTADKIIVLDNGKIAGIGTHEQLLKTCDEYKQIALSQLDKEEL